MAWDQRERARRPGDGGSRRASDLLPGMLELRVPRQGRPVPPSRAVTAQKQALIEGQYRP